LIRPARILHLSDPHFHRLQYRSEVAEHFFECIESLEPKPEILVISGDFAFNGEESSYLKAATFIDRTRRALRIQDDHSVHVVPGNHDFGRLRYLFSREWSSCHFQSHLGRYFRKAPHYFSEFNLTIWCLDSSHSLLWERFLNLISLRYLKLTVDGKIGKATLKCVGRHFSELRTRTGGPALLDARRRLSSFKLAVLHHHPLPVPVAGEKLLSVMEDAGDFLGGGPHRLDHFRGPNLCARGSAKFE
jgi:3',5'-cyclic AMP phosphodiesterase CpdA